MSNANCANRFSQNYKLDTSLYPDSKKFRVRFNRYLYKLFNRIKSCNELIEWIEKEVGIVINTSIMSLDACWSVQEFILTAHIKDILKTVTIAYQLLNSATERQKLIDFINQCFGEENLHYKADQQGIVNFNPDEEFHLVKQTTLQSLQDKRYALVANEFNKAYQHLNDGDNHHNDAITALFKSVETLFRLLCDNDKQIKRLECNVVAKYLAKITKKVYHDMSPDQYKELYNKVINHKISEFKHWINAAHYYRHGQNQQAIQTPPRDLTILILATGTAFIRWLVTLHQAILANRIDAQHDQ